VPHCSVGRVGHAVQVIGGGGATAGSPVESVVGEEAGAVVGEVAGDAFGADVAAGEVAGDAIGADVVPEEHDAAVKAPTTASGAKRAPPDGRLMRRRKGMAGNGTSTA
jgi:hypothetical protein